MLMHWGGGENYCWGLTALCAARAGILIGENRGLEPANLLRAAALCALLFFPAPPVTSLHPTPRQDNPSTAALKEYFGQNRFQNLLINTEAGSTALEMGLAEGYPGAATFFDGFDLYFYERAGLWKPAASKLFSDVRERRYDAVVAGSSFVTPSFYWNLQSVYEKERSIGYMSVYRPLPGSLVRYDRPTDQPVLENGLTLTTLSVEGAYVEESFNAFFFSKRENVPKAVITFALTSPAPMEAVRVQAAMIIKRTADGDAVTVSWSADGEHYEEAYRFDGPVPPNSDLMQYGRIFSFAPRGAKTITVRLTLTGSGQVWFNQDYPLCFLVRQGQ